MNTINKDKVIREITDAFDQVPKPDRITLQVARGIDDYLSDEELTQLGDTREGSRCQDIPDKILEEYWDVYPFLCPVGFRYYLPAFMIWTINNYQTSDFNIPQWTISSVNYLSDDKLELLSRRQRSIIAKFLKFGSEHFDNFDGPEARKVYEDFWKQFDAQ